jgi:hypothetical protein
LRGTDVTSGCDTRDVSEHVRLRFGSSIRVFDSRHPVLLSGVHNGTRCTVSVDRWPRAGATGVLLTPPVTFRANKSSARGDDIGGRRLRPGSFRRAAAGNHEHVALACQLRQFPVGDRKSASNSWPWLLSMLPAPGVARPSTPRSRSSGTPRSLGGNEIEASTVESEPESSKGNDNRCFASIKHLTRSGITDTS